MTYGRQSIMNGLRKAGQTLLDMDERYAKAIEDRLPQNPNVVQGFGGFGSAIPIREIHPFANEKTADKFIDAGILGANIASRYLLPAGGVTLAGKGLYDLSQGLYAVADATPVFGGPEDGQQPGQLPLN